MPAEVINDENNPEWRAQVHWGRNMQVQVSSVCHRVRGDDSGWEGTFVTLDREGCNRMIRALRKARDQAYGQDA